MTIEAVRYPESQLQMEQLVTASPPGTCFLITGQLPKAGFNGPIDVNVPPTAFDSIADHRLGIATPGKSFYTLMIRNKGGWEWGRHGPDVALAPRCGTVLGREVDLVLLREQKTWTAPLVFIHIPEPRQQ
jgi:hypothetical protein